MDVRAESGMQGWKMNEIEMRDMKDKNNKRKFKKCSAYVSKIEYRHIYAGKVNMTSTIFFFYILSYLLVYFLII